MSIEGSRSTAVAFARPPKIFGAALLLIGVLMILLSFLIADASPVVRIAGYAFAIVGMFAFGFGLLIQFANKSPRQGQSGPSA